MDNKIEIGDRYECIGGSLYGFIRNKIYNVEDVGKYIWLFNDNKSYINFSLNQLNLHFKLIKKVEK